MAFLFYFDKMNFVILDGNFVKETAALLSPANHSYRYGDGLFETMKVIAGKILLKEYHFERLFSGLKTLKYNIPDLFTAQKIGKEVTELCKKNNCDGSARVRFSVARGNGGLYDCDSRLSYLIECWPLEQNIETLNENALLSDRQGLVIDIFPDAGKSIDAFSNLKSANYLPYVMAAVWAKENKLNDALILNQHNRICEATIANIFWVRNENIFTPGLNEGCVAGVMRRKLLDLDLGIEETELTEDTLFNADEVFLTNVITGIRWVKQYRDKVYQNRVTNKVFALLTRHL